ncbi:MAG: anti-sigma factor family protein, partial [Candidatus Limnocylindria bacterium]
MTMHHSTHPDDERLAAYASADREAVSDRELAAHVDSCDRCRPIVDELAILRDALALLPDIAPSRPLRLVPPVAEPAGRRSGALGWVRRLAAPAMATGAGLVLVGAFGISGLAGGLASKAVDVSGQESSNGAGAPADNGGAHSPVPAMGSDAEFGRTETPRSQFGGESPAPTPAPSASQDHGFE